MFIMMVWIYLFLIYLIKHQLWLVYDYTDLFIFNVTIDESNDHRKLKEVE